MRDLATSLWFPVNLFWSYEVRQQLAPITLVMITLTTDFGTKDWFVGTMKGVILSIHPQATIVDVTHEISPGDVRAGAFALKAGCKFFPKGTIHVAVVDPGVGSDRQAIAVRTDAHTFIGPDNGVLSWAVGQEKIKSIRRLDNSRLFLSSVSRTFHGRDIFAPVAGHLEAGVHFDEVGRELKTMERLAWPRVQRRKNELLGQVLYVDRFGNAITNLPAERDLLSGRRAYEVHFESGIQVQLRECYASVRPGNALCLVGSSGLIEISVNKGSAADMLGLKAGDRVILRGGRSVAKPRS